MRDQRNYSKIKIGTDMCSDYGVTEVNFTATKGDEELNNVFGTLGVDVYGK